MSTARESTSLKTTVVTTMETVWGCQWGSHQIDKQWLGEPIEVRESVELDQIEVQDFIPARQCQMLTIGEPGIAAQKMQKVLLGAVLMKRDGRIKEGGISWEQDVPAM
jgi:hypothetical protein